VAPEREPVFNAPAAVVAAVAVLVAVHLARGLLSEAHDDWFVLAMAFIPARYAGHAAEIPGGAVAGVTSFVTHILVHGSAMHLLINSAWLLAFGAPICKRIGPKRFLAFFVCSGIAGALTFLAFNPGLAAPVVGASGAISGLMGGVLRFMFSALNDGNGWMLRDAPQQIPRMDLAKALRDRRFLIATLSFIGLNFLAAWGFGEALAGAPIAWEAHIGGFLFGVLAFAPFDGALRIEPSI
jgi:membrane associated rhomboid family serine protease